MSHKRQCGRPNRYNMDQPEMRHITEVEIADDFFFAPLNERTTTIDCRRICGDNDEWLEDALVSAICY